MLPLKRQGVHLVLREVDKDGKQVVKAHALVKRGDNRPDTWRRALYRLTNGGKDMQEVLINLMNGHAYYPTLKDGRQMADPVVPTAEVRRAAAMNLHEMLHGKAVAETEVRQAEAESMKKLQLESLSDEALEQYINGDYKVLPEGEDEEGDEAPAPETVTENEP